MNIGMLWFDNDPKTEFNAKIERAAIYYRNKYGKAPNLCFVHPSMLGQAVPAKSEMVAEINNPGKNGAYKNIALNNSALHSGSVEVRTSASIRPNHFWIGVAGTIQPTES